MWICCQNWWASKPFVEISHDLLAAMMAEQLFVKKTLTENHRLTHSIAGGHDVLLIKDLATETCVDVEPANDDPCV